jgi:hypothetical protein
MTPPSPLCGLESQQDGLRKSLSAMRELGLTAKGSYAAHTRLPQHDVQSSELPADGNFRMLDEPSSISAADVGRCHTSAMPDCGDNALSSRLRDAGLSQCDLSHKRRPGPPR